MVLRRPVELSVERGGETSTVACKTLASLVFMGQRAPTPMAPNLLLNDTLEQVIFVLQQYINPVLRCFYFRLLVCEVLPYRLYRNRYGTSRQSDSILT
jgi:hypothetical protein